MKEYTKEQCIEETMDHISKVYENILKVIANLARRSFVHDASKMQEPELGIFVEYTPKLANTTYGSDEYKEHLKGMQIALDHHYETNLVIMKTSEYQRLKAIEKEYEKSLKVWKEVGK